MGLWQELNDFSAWDKRIPCSLCRGNSEPTLVGGHFKCSLCSHIFNENGSKLNIECYCDACIPKEQLEPIDDLKKKVKRSKKKH